MANYEYAGTIYGTERKMFCAQAFDFIVGDGKVCKSHLEYATKTSREDVYIDMQDADWRFDGDMYDLKIALEDAAEMMREQLSED